MAGSPLRTPHRIPQVDGIPAPPGVQCGTTLLDGAGLLRAQRYSADVPDRARWIVAFPGRRWRRGRGRDGQRLAGPGRHVTLLAHTDCLLPRMEPLSGNWPAAPWPRPGWMCVSVSPSPGAPPGRHRAGHPDLRLQGAEMSNPPVGFSDAAGNGHSPRDASVKAGLRGVSSEAVPLDVDRPSSLTRCSLPLRPIADKGNDQGCHCRDTPARCVIVGQYQLCRWPGRRCPAVPGRSRPVHPFRRHVSSSGQGSRSYVQRS